MLSIWFRNDDSARLGASEFLRELRGFAPAELALQSIQNGQSLRESGSMFWYRLSALFEQEQKRIAELELNLKSCQSMQNSLQSQVDAYFANPLHWQLDRARTALAEQTTQAENARREAARLQTALEHECSLHQQDVKKLQDDITDLERLTASQHEKLAGLFGAEQPT
jgi:chromosome segregation ATPase